jgi:hypothetical protein
LTDSKFPGLRGDGVDAFGGPGEHAELTGREFFECCGQRLDATSASGIEGSAPFGCSKHLLNPAILRIDFAPNQTLRLHRGYQACHGRSAHLFRRSQFTHRNRAGIDHHREGRKARSAEAGLFVHPPEAPEQVYGGGVQAIGDPHRVDLSLRATRRHDIFLSNAKYYETIRDIGQATGGGEEER